MSVKIVAQLHPFSSDRTEVTVERDAIKKLIHDIAPGADLACCRVLFDDEIITDFDRIPEDDQVVFVKMVPQGDGPMADTGGKMAGWGGFLAVLGTVAMILSGPAGWAFGIGAIFIGTGVSMMLGGAVLANYDPTAAKSRETPEENPSIRGSKNQTRQHGYLPVILGRHLISPDFAASPYTEIDGNDQWVVQLYCAGYNNIEIEKDSIKIGDTLLENYSASKNLDTILAGQDASIKMEILLAGEESALYPKVCRETALNQVLNNLYDDGTDGSIIRTTPSGSTAVNVDIFFYRGLGKYNDDGDVIDASVEVYAWIKKSTDPDSAYVDMGSWQSSGHTITGSELKTKRFQLEVTDLPPAAYTVKVQRITADSTDSKVIDEVYVGSIRAFTEDRPVRAGRAKNLTIIALKAKATDRLNGAIDTLNFIAQSRLPIYSGQGSGSASWQTVSKTSNPAAILLYALQGQINSDPVSSEHIDWNSLEVWYKWCETNNYSCNVVLSDKIQISELLDNIGKTARAECLKIDSRFSVVQDKVREAPVQLFTPRNTKNYQQTIAFSDVPDALEMTFIDADSDFQENQRLVYNTNSGESSGVDPKTKQTADLWGVTNARQAFLIGRYDYGCMLLRPRIHKIEVDLEYLLSRKGDWIKYAGDTALIGTSYGRVRGRVNSGQQVTGIIVDEQITIESGRTYALRLRRRDASVVLINVLSTIGASNVLTFEAPILNAEAPDSGDLFSFGERGKESLDLIITDIEPVDDWNATLTCIDYSPDIFGVDDPDYVIPAFDNKITVGGIVDDGVVSVIDWKTFETYSDSLTEPAVPTGTGTDGVWHAEQTVRAVWRSTKKSASRGVGAWGGPVRIVGVEGPQGLDGQSIFTAPIYKQSTSIPAAPSGGSFNFLNGLLIPPDGWSASIPTATKTPTYLSVYTFKTITPDVPVIGGDWSDPVIFTAVGSDGTTFVIKAALSSYLNLPVTPVIGDAYKLTNAGGTDGNGKAYVAEAIAYYTGSMWISLGSFSGPKGDSGTTYYFYVRYSAYADGTAFGTAGNTYMGSCVTTSSVAPTDKSAYIWVRVVGKDAYWKITDPTETNGSHEVPTYGEYGGHIYSWTATTATTGFWTLVPPEKALGVSLGMYFSFDEPIDNSDGSILVLDNAGQGRDGIARNCSTTTGRSGKALALTNAAAYIGIY